MLRQSTAAPSATRIGAIGSWATGLFLACSVMATVRSAAANPFAVLVYARSADASQCGGEAELRRAVVRRLGYDAFVPLAESTVVAEIRGEGEGLKARVVLIERGATVGGARELTSRTKDCGELMLAVALAISIAIDPEAMDRPETVSSPNTPGSEQPFSEETKGGEAGPDTVTEPSNRPPGKVAGPRGPSLRPNQPPVAGTRRGIRASLGIGTTVASGPVPLPAWGVQATLGLLARRWWLGISPRWLPSAQGVKQAETGARAATEMVGASLAPCLLSGSWLGCYVLDVARLESTGKVTRPNTDRSLWAAQGLRIGYRVGSHYGWGLAATLDGLWAFTQITLVLNRRPAFETPRFLGRLGLEVQYIF